MCETECEKEMESKGEKTHRKAEEAEVGAGVSYLNRLVVVMMFKLLFLDSPSIQSYRFPWPLAVSVHVCLTVRVFVSLCLPVWAC